MSEKQLLCAENIKITYGEQEVLNFEKFRLYEGDRIGLVGANGAGKTTLLNMIISRNQVSVVPQTRIGYVSQNLAEIDAGKTVLQNALSVSIQKEDITRIILARLLLTGRDMNKKASDLSGGERMKLAFAMLFVSNVNVLILDEPTNYMDLPSIEALEKLLQEYEGTLLFVSHDMKFVDNVATQKLIISDKKIIEL